MVYMAHLAIENGPTFSVALVDGPVAFQRGGACPHYPRVASRIAQFCQLDN